MSKAIISTFTRNAKAGELGKQTNCYVSGSLLIFAFDIICPVDTFQAFKSRLKEATIDSDLDSAFARFKCSDNAIEAKTGGPNHVGNGNLVTRK